MTKQEQFLWMVQTVTLANVSNVASQPEYAEKFRATISARGVVFTAAEALRASALIPDDMTAADAASEFCVYMNENLRGTDSDCPDWFALS